MKEIICYPPVDMSKPFGSLKPQEIDLYFHYTNEIGKNTCAAKCEHCYFTNTENFAIPFATAMEITNCLLAKGYNIGLAPADTFGYDEGKLFLQKVMDYETENKQRSAGSAYRLREVGKSARTGGRQLITKMNEIGEDVKSTQWYDKLQLASQLGYESIIITGHNVAGTPVDLKGITPGNVVQQAVGNINTWNEISQQAKFDILVTFTLGNHNLNIENMRKMTEWSIENNVAVTRFNCFANFQQKDDLKQYELSKFQIGEFGKYLAILCAEYESKPIRFGLSEDRGDGFLNEALLPYLGEARKQKYQMQDKTWCRAGYKLFSIIEKNGRTLVVGCVDAREPILGEIKLGDGGYDIERNIQEIENLRNFLLKGDVYSCYGGVGKGRGDEAGFGVNKVSETSIFGS